MDLDRPISRKLDFVLAIGAVLLLWGPGLTLPGGGRPVLTSRAQAAINPAPAPANPCMDEPDILPVAAGTRFDQYAAFQVTVTGYSSSIHETDESPGLTATNTEARAGVIALSQDLLREFTPGAPFSFHDRVEIPGLGQFRVEDTMHPRWTRRADVWFGSRAEALDWGRRSRRLYRLPDSMAASLPIPGRNEVAATFGKANFQ
jgi:3D (Asp-Asp-Asp) domain-containing protein